LETDLEMAREFLAAMVNRILFHPLSTTKEHRQGTRCPLCGLSIKKLTATARRQARTLGGGDSHGAPAVRSEPAG
jgi:hypothetical protein